MGEQTAHVDTFVRDHLPPPEDWPVLDYSGTPELRSYPARLNCAVELLDRMVEQGHGERTAVRFEGRMLSYRALLEQANRIARALTEELGLRPGERVLLRGFNGPEMAACWLAVLKAGGVNVATMPLLRARELRYTIDKARVALTLCDARLAGELTAALDRPGEQGCRVVLWGTDAPDGLEGLTAGKPPGFENVDTAADDPALIAFTSGTTGPPKGAVHSHRDVLAACDCFPTHILAPTADDVFAGTPPLAFTYGLGQILLFPLRVGAAAALFERPAPEVLLETIQRERVTICATAPTMYRAMLPLLEGYDISSLRTCVSAGESLPLPTYEAWLAKTGLMIVDGIGATEMLHIFIACSGDAIRPGSTGKTVPGYRARVTDEQGAELPPGEIGLLAVQGPTGCRYLADPERQRGYVRGGWNYTGDAYLRDAEGYFWFQGRADDMIVSSGYNISAAEVESVLLDHPKVSECGVVAAPDPERGVIVKAFVVLRDAAAAGEATVRELQEFVKREIAPYKYPRAIEFVSALPRTETGKLQRYKLRELEKERAGR